MSATRSLPGLSSQQLAVTIAAARQTRNQAVWQQIGHAFRRLATRLAGTATVRTVPLTPHSHA